MRKLMQHLGLSEADILFVGDRLDEGGNDYPVRAMGVPCVAVKRWEETADYLAALLDRPAWPVAAELAAEHASVPANHAPARPARPRPAVPDRRLAGAP